MENFSKVADDLDDREAGLVNDCVRELSEASERMNLVHDELGAKSELVVAQQRKIEHLMDKISSLEKHIVEVCFTCLTYERLILVHCFTCLTYQRLIFLVISF